MAQQEPISWSTPTATPSIPLKSVVFTAGASITIHAAAEVVFEVLVDFGRYHEWNSWTSSLTFTSGEASPVGPGSKGVLKAHMASQNRDYDIPVEVLELSRSPEQSRIVWQSQLLPKWIGRIERVQTVKPIDDQICEVQSYETMSGAAAYVFKHVMGVPGQVSGHNLQYLRDLRDYVLK